MNHDTIIIGGGHNGLTAAARLARQGRRVLVLERRDIVGGIAAGEEFHPGYRTAGLLHDTTGVRASVIDKLRLERHSLKRDAEPPAIFAPQATGRGLLLHHDAGRAEAEIAAFSARDAAAYHEYRAFFERIRGVIETLINEIPPDLDDTTPGNLLALLRTGWSVRRLGEKDMMELLRIMPMCVADWLGEWFESELLKTTLAGPAIYGEFVGPWSPGTNGLLVLHECTKRGAIVGGPAALARALEAACRAAGLTIRTRAEVQRVNIEHGRVVGVTLADGESIGAKTVVAACSPKHALGTLVGGAHVSQKLAHRIDNFRTRGTTAKLHLAIRGPFTFRSRPEEAIEFARIAPTIDDMERAFDAVKYRVFSERPILDICVPTVSAPSLAPQGDSVASVLVHFAPYDLDGGWNERQAEVLKQAALRVLEPHVEHLPDRIVATELLTPLDLERRYGLTCGQIHHGEHGLDQLLVRPTLECARYATPITGLYLASGGSFPGGGITCAPGALAAAAIRQATVR